MNIKENDAIEFNPKKLKLFIESYESCREESFMFDGHEILRKYARHMISYLDRQGLKPED